jgi:hypothetical protein
MALSYSNCDVCSTPLLSSKSLDGEVGPTGDNVCALGYSANRGVGANPPPVGVRQSSAVLMISPDAFEFSWGGFEYSVNKFCPAKYRNRLRLKA